MKQLANAAIAAATLATLLCLIPMSPALAGGRYVINQTPETLQRYFGRPIRIQTGQTADQKIYTYSATKLRRVLPRLNQRSEFGVTFNANRAATVWLNVNPVVPADYFSFGKKEAIRFYNYVFAYEPPLWKRVPLPNGGGGHEGFSENKFCFGDGVATTFISFSGGDESIQLVYDPLCEPPY